MTQDRPVISVIMATWGRGRHILPSIQSVLRQDFPRLELIVVGDACTDETEAVVNGIGDPRLRWLNLAERCGSQSAPNTAGIAVARSEIIAYLGHDDLWEPDHLTKVLRQFDIEDAPDFVVSGLIAHMPNGLEGSAVTGLFTQDSDKHRYFFPPSSFAHRKSVLDRIGGWRMPKEVRAPVDADLLLRAKAADLRFVSTGSVTVHKFTSVLRYLSYLQPCSDEQVEMLADFNAADHALRMERIVDTSRRLGRFMPESRETYDDLEPGELARNSAKRRGISVPHLRPLGIGAVLRQGPENCWLDWQKRPRFGVRFNTRNPSPRFLLPFTSAGPVALTISAVHPDRRALGPLHLLCNGVPVTAQPVGLGLGLFGWTTRYEVAVDLRAELPSVLEFRLDGRQHKKRRWGLSHHGFGIGKVVLKPIAT